MPIELPINIKNYRTDHVFAYISMFYYRTDLKDVEKLPDRPCFRLYINVLLPDRPTRWGKITGQT
jgi:hypothetical protein